MRDLTRTTDFGVAANHPVGATVEASVLSEDQSIETIPVLEESLQISKREVVTGGVRVSIRTEMYEQIAEASLDRTAVDLTRVPVGEFVDVAPTMRTEGDATIVPVVEARLVVVKRLFLVEELRICQRVEHETVSEIVPLRRQQVIIDRVDGNGDLGASPPIDG